MLGLGELLLGVLALGDVLRCAAPADDLAVDEEGSARAWIQRRLPSASTIRYSSSECAFVRLRADVRLLEQRVVVGMDALEQILERDLRPRRVDLEEAAELLRNGDRPRREVGLPAPDAHDVLRLGQPHLAPRDCLLRSLAAR